MPPFQTPLQRFITSGQLAIWMLGSLPLFFRLLLSLLPSDGSLDLDAETLGWLLVLGIAFRVYRFVAYVSFRNMTVQGRSLWRNRWSYRFWLGSLGIGTYLLVTQMLPLWVGLLLDVGILAIVVRHGRTRAKELVDDLAFFAYWDR